MAAYSVDEVEDYHDLFFKLISTYMFHSVSIYFNIGIARAN